MSNLNEGFTVIQQIELPRPSILIYTCTRLFNVVNMLKCMTASSEWVEVNRCSCGNLKTMKPGDNGSFLQGHKYNYVSFLDHNFAKYYVSKYSFLHAFCFKDLFIAC